MTTQVGQQIPEFFKYMALFVEQVVLNLRGGLTFVDNFSCDVKTVKLKHGIPQALGVSNTVIGVIPVRVTSSTKSLASFNWYYDTNGKFTVAARFADNTDTQAGSQVGVELSLDLVILF